MRKELNIQNDLAKPGSKKAKELLLHPFECILSFSLSFTPIHSHSFVLTRSLCLSVSVEQLMKVRCRPLV